MPLSQEELRWKFSSRSLAYCLTYLRLGKNTSSRLEKKKKTSQASSVTYLKPETYCVTSPVIITVMIITTTMANSHYCHYYYIYFCHYYF